MQRVAFYLILTLAACHAARVPAQNASSSGLEPDLKTVLKGPNSHVRNTLREVVRDSVRWHAIRDSLYPDPKPVSEPLVDFRREMLLVAVGPPSGGGDSVVITRITHSKHNKKVRVAVYQGCSPTQISTMPFHVVRVPRWQGKPVFEEHVRTDPECVG